MLQLIDSHAHLHLPAYDSDRMTILERMKQDQIGAITVGTNQRTSRQAVELAEKTDMVFASVAYHPEHLTSTYIDPSEDISYQPFQREEIEIIARSSKKVVAIGETGLDYYRMDDGMDIENGKSYQKEVFEWHLDLAEQLEIPVIVHVRDAFDDVIDIIQRRRLNGYRQGIVIHCFTGDWKLAKRFLDLDCHLSFTGIITFKPRAKDDAEEHVHRVIERMPIERLMIETDAPWLAPVPHRGERNEPAYVLEVAKKVAELRSVSIETISRETVQNTRSFFHIQ